MLLRSFVGHIGTALSIAMAASCAHADQIFIGQVAPLSGLEANQGQAYSAGLQLYFDSVNRMGGVNGHTFKLVTRDDGGRAAQTLEVTRQLLEEVRPMALAGYFGAANVAELVKAGILASERVALVGYRTSEIGPDTPLLYSVRAGVREEINKIANHLGTIGITRLGLLYEEGPGSTAVVAAAEEAVAKNRAALVAKAAYPAGSVKVGASVASLVSAVPQAIVMVATGAAAAAFIEQYRMANGTAQLVAYSGADIDQLSKRLSEEQMQGVAIAQVVPNPYKISSRISKEFIELVARMPGLEARVSYTMMEGYIAAKVIVEAVRRQGIKPTREGIGAALDNMQDLDVGGYFVAFRPGMRTGSKFVELSIISSAGRIRQ